MLFALRGLHLGASLGEERHATIGSQSQRGGLGTVFSDEIQPNFIDKTRFFYSNDKIKYQSKFLGFFCSHVDGPNSPA